jgi:hypothetical protein
MPIQMRQQSKRRRIPTIVIQKAPAAVKAKMSSDVNKIIASFLKLSSIL